MKERGGGKGGRGRGGGEKEGGGREEREERGKDKELMKKSHGKVEKPDL